MTPAEQVPSLRDRTSCIARRELAHGEPEVFAIWVLGYLQGIEDTYNRYAALDGIMEAMQSTC